MASASWDYMATKNYLSVYPSRCWEDINICNAKWWQWITRLINKIETTVMVSCLFPHLSSNILFFSHACPSSVGYFIVFSLLSVIPSVPRRTALFMTLLVPSLLLGYRPTHSCTVWIVSCWNAWSISVLRFFVGVSSPYMYSMAQFINWALIFMNAVPCSGFVIWSDSSLQLGSPQS